MILRAAVILLALAASAVAQDFESLPPYTPDLQVTGAIRSLGNYHMETVLKYWQDGFSKLQPGVRFENKMLGTANAIAGLYLETADLAIMGREILPIELVAYRRVFRHDPLEIAVATASFNIPLETFAFAIFVHRDNPLRQITLQQVDAIFGSQHKTGAPENIRTWGQLGLKGEWANRPIHTYGYETNTGLGTFFSDKVLGGSHLFNGDLHEYANRNSPDGKVLANAGDLIVKDLSNDLGGIAFCGFGHKTAGVKALALSGSNGGPFVELTRENVANRTYPLTRTVYVDLRNDEGHPVGPALREFLKYILSRQGQQDVARQNIYIPLTRAAAEAGLARLK